MKIEAGKTYGTRDGLRARVISITHDNGYPAKGYIEQREHEWTIDGYFNTSGELDIADLVAEWEEPVKEAPKPTRKIVQIVAHPAVGQFSPSSSIIYALCDDGTTWAMAVMEAPLMQWSQFPPIPQTGG